MQISNELDEFNEISDTFLKKGNLDCHISHNKRKFLVDRIEPSFKNSFYETN